MCIYYPIYSSRSNPYLSVGVFFVGTHPTSTLLGLHRTQRQKIGPPTGEIVFDHYGRNILATTVVPCKIVPDPKCYGNYTNKNGHDSYNTPTIASRQKGAYGR